LRPIAARDRARRGKEVPMNEPENPVNSGSVRQRAFNVVGWIAFLLLVPPALSMIGLPRLQELIAARLGAWGSPVALVIYFYIILFLRVFFGSDQRYAPVLMGYLTSFVYFSNSLDIGFMAWLRGLTAGIPPLSYRYMSFIAGIATIFIANALSGAKKGTWIIDAILLILLPAGVLVAAGVYLPGLLGL